MVIGITQVEENNYTVTFNEKPIIATRVRSDLQLSRWIREVQIVYGKRHRQNIVCGLSVDRIVNYSNGPSHRFLKGYGKDEPFDLLKLCVGRHCLIYELHALGAATTLKKFLDDKHTIVVGVGIEQIAKKLEKDNHIVISRTFELNDLAKDLLENNSERFSIQELAKVVLGEEFKYGKPRKIKWFSGTSAETLLSDDLIKYATVEAFLASEMSLKLLPDRNGVPFHPET